MAELNDDKKATVEEMLESLVEQTQINTLILLRIYDCLNSTLDGTMALREAEKLRELHERGGIVNDNVSYDPNAAV